MSISIKMSYNTNYQDYTFKEITSILNSTEFQSYINQEYENMKEKKKCVSQIMCQFVDSKNKF